MTDDLDDFDAVVSPRRRIAQTGMWWCPCCFRSLTYYYGMRVKCGCGHTAKMRDDVLDEEQMAGRRAIVDEEMKAAKRDGLIR